MGFRGREGRRLFLAGAMLLALFPLVSGRPMPLVQSEALMNEELSAIASAGFFQSSEAILLTEVVQREDSVVYRTDSKDLEYQQRQREEREKEKKSWNMLNNVIIDGRQPPRRFSDPRANDSPQ